MNERRRVLLLHGWRNHRPAGHWQSWLAGRLRGAGHEVAFPQLPHPDRPDPDVWTRVIAGRVADRPGSWTVICHGLSCAAWMRLAMSSIPPVCRLLFVAPPSVSFLAGTPELRGFVPPPGSFDRVAGTTLERPRLACSDRDPYCEPPANFIFPEAFDVHRVSGGGHLDQDAGLGPWPELFDWCADPELRITCGRLAATPG